MMVGNIIGQTVRHMNRSSIMVMVLVTCSPCNCAGADPCSNLYGCAYDAISRLVRTTKREGHRFNRKISIA
jgi:hypothetical protein